MRMSDRYRVYYVAKSFQGAIATLEIAGGLPIRVDEVNRVSNSLPTVKFRAKVEEVYEMDGKFGFHQVKVPDIKPTHCDMAAFRTHARFGGLANSQLFPAVLKRELLAMGVRPGGYLRLDQLPEGVHVDTSGFLTLVTITVDSPPTGGRPGGSSGRERVG